MILWGVGITISFLQFAANKTLNLLLRLITFLPPSCRVWQKKEEEKNNDHKKKYPAKTAANEFPTQPHLTWSPLALPATSEAYYLQRQQIWSGTGRCYPVADYFRVPVPQSQRQPLCCLRAELTSRTWPVKRIFNYKHPRYQLSIHFERRHMSEQD